jgi:outer membrane biogenesis lipoprotein LolB
MFLNNKRLLPFAITILSSLLLSACGEEEPAPPKEGHVWKAQTDTIAHTRDVVGDVEKSMQLQQQRIDEGRD